MNTEWTIAPTRNGQAHEIRIHPPGGVRGGSSLRFPALLQAESREGGKVTVAIDEATATENGIRAFGKSELFQAETRFTRRSGECSYFDVAAEVVYTGARPAEWTLQVEAELLGEGRPDWMIPGAFYKENRFETNLRLYPRYDYEGGDASRLVSDKVYAGSPDPHAYNPFVRQMYELHKREHALNPWMGLEEAAELTAHGLYTWHYRPEHGILCETAAFDREFNNNVNGMGDRPHMHVGWVSGAPYAYALLTYGTKQRNKDYREAGASVLDKIASGLAPCGTFWASWIVGKGWTAGWNPRKDWLQARTIAEATLFMIRAIAFERERGEERPDWELAAVSNLSFAAAHQREDGNFGSYYNSDTGKVEEWDGAGGMLWIAALLEGAKLFGESAFSEAAVRAGGYYGKFVRNEYIYGAPEDVHLTPTSEDAYNAVAAYVALYEFDRSEEWLALAASAADWMMTFRWTYNLEFPRHSLLKQYDFRSRGADQASASNQHLHNYGLFCVPEMLRLWTYTGDDYYLERTRDHIACFLQFIAREDGDFNAYKGMVTERFYNTNCFQPKGMMLTLSHSWCVGLILYASQEALAYADELGL